MQHFNTKQAILCTCICNKYHVTLHIKHDKKRQGQQDLQD